MTFQEAIKKEKALVRKIAKYREGTWVKFHTGKRTLSGRIIGRFRNIGDTISYDIARNKQTFQSIPERDILEIVK